MNWSIHKFSELDTQLLYDILQIRAEVFVVEQDCPYQDLDGKDMQSFHVCGYDENGLAAYARIVKKGVSYLDEISIGRVVVSPNHRGKRLGEQLMQESIRFIEISLGKQPIRISAQSHLNKFYSDLGFEFTGKEYLEDGIPHIEMLRK
ncbi:GNAT family N-acetyltransferase [bacterium SCSIO 12643]|nr:GNAT family N-acetyltransferase [bacterium SCSIO 12643]